MDHRCWHAFFGVRRGSCFQTPDQCNRSTESLLREQHIFWAAGLAAAATSTPLSDPPTEIGNDAKLYCPSASRRSRAPRKRRIHGCQAAPYAEGCDRPQYRPAVKWQRRRLCVPRLPQLTPQPRLRQPRPLFVVVVLSARCRCLSDMALDCPQGAALVNGLSRPIPKRGAYASDLL